MRIFGEYSRRFFHRCTQMKAQMFTDKTSVLISVSYQGSSVEGSFCFPGTQIPADLRDFLRLFHEKRISRILTDSTEKLHGAWGFASSPPRFLSRIVPILRGSRDFGCASAFYFLLPTEFCLKSFASSHPFVLRFLLSPFHLSLSSL